MVPNPLATLLAPDRSRGAEARLGELHAAAPFRLERKVHALFGRRPSVLSARVVNGVSKEASPRRWRLSIRAQADGTRELVTGLRVALAGGGSETALQHADELAAARGRTLDVETLELISRAFVTAGRHDEARVLWERCAPASARSNATWVMLRAVSEEAAFPWTAPSAGHPFVLDFGLQRERLSQDQAAGLLLRQRLCSVLNPEWYLLQHNAARTAASSDSAGLRHYFEARGLSLGFEGFESGVVKNARKLRQGASSTGRPVVSVVMAARNAARTVLAAASSILVQTYPDLELLICDDESDDDTAKVLREAFEHDPRVRLFRSRRRQGTYNVRNQLFAQSRGELVTTQDADDFALPSRIAEQVHALKQTHADACIGNWLRLRSNGSVVFFWDQRALRLSVVSLMLRKQVWERMGPYRSANYGADLEYLEKLRHGPCRIARVSRPLMLSLWADASLTRSAQGEALESGYRSPGRRAYGEVVFQRHLLGAEAVPDAVVDDLLRQHHNHREPAAIEVLR